MTPAAQWRPLVVDEVAVEGAPVGGAESTDGARVRVVRPVTRRVREEERQLPIRHRTRALIELKQHHRRREQAKVLTSMGKTAFFPI